MWRSSLRSWHVFARLNIAWFSFNLFHFHIEIVCLLMIILRFECLCIWEMSCEMGDTIRWIIFLYWLTNYYIFTIVLAICFEENIFLNLRERENHYILILEYSIYILMKLYSLLWGIIVLTLECLFPWFIFIN